MRRLSLFGLLIAVLLAACAGGGDATAPVASDPASEAPASAAATASDPAEEPTADGTGEVSGDAPERIVSLAPTHTETLFALGAGDRVVAVDDQSNHPEDAPVTDLSGFQPNVEAIAGYDPDLVVLSDDIDGVVGELDAVGVETLLLPAAASLDEVYDQISQIGTAVGAEDAAVDLVASMRDEIDELTADVPDRPEPLRYYHELDDTLYTVTSDTFIGQLYGLAGMESVADAADPNGEAGGYPQLSPEFLVEADPDMVFLADVKCCGQSAETVAARPGFAELTAVQQGRVVELDDDVASRWGPRVVDLLRTIVESSSPVAAG